MAIIAGVFLHFVSHLLITVQAAIFITCINTVHLCARVPLMLLYIHVPFCRTKCQYCTFYSTALPEGSKGASMAGVYLSTLLQEITLWGERLGAAPVETIFFGGGTPSLLPVKAMGGILDKIAATFTVSSTAEITTEANPDSALEGDWLYGVRNAGINRLSLGLQSTDEEFLHILGRIHSTQQAYAAFKQAREAHFTSINLDLMWGLPGVGKPQQLRHWIRTLQTATSLEPNHISAYGLTLEPESLLATRCEQGELVMPSEQALSLMYLQGSEYLETQGLMQYEISNYARLGHECRHNIGYWSGANYLGLGPSATSTLGLKRWTSPPNLMRWKQCVETKAIGSSDMLQLGADFEELTEEIKQQETIMLRLRTTKGLHLPTWQEQTGKSFLQEYSQLTKLLQKNHLASVRNGYFKLTRRGMLVSNTIIEHFFTEMETHLPPDQIY